MIKAVVSTAFCILDILFSLIDLISISKTESLVVISWLTSTKSLSCFPQFNID